MNHAIPKRVGPYNVVCKIGYGSFSSVYQGYNSINHQIVALKFVSREILRNASIIQKFEREIRISERVSHKSIVNFYSVHYLDDYVVIAMECLGNGTLASFRENSIFSIGDPIYLKWGKQILEGLQYLHHKGIAHHDIKPENIGFDDYMNAKILDLGLCEEFSGLCSDKSGTLLFNAPELFCSKQYDGVKSDIWAFGVTFHCLVTGYFPFSNAECFEGTITKKSFTNNINNMLKEPLKKIVDMALTIDPKERPTADELLDLEVFKLAEKEEEPRLSKKKVNVVPRKRNSMKNIIIAPLERRKSLKREVSDVTFFRKRYF